MAKANKHFKKRGSLWGALAVILLLLVLLTAAPVETRIIGTLEDAGDTGAQNVISLQAMESDTTTAAQGTTPLQVNDTKDGAPRTWTGEKVNEIDLFAESYINNGETTVNSGGGEEVADMVAPGTSGTYNFTVQNTGSLPLTYYITVKKGTFSIDETELPIQLKLRSADQTVVDDTSGDESAADDTSGSWGEASYDETESLDNYEITSKTIELPGNSSDEYTLDWIWLYENGIDGIDTDFGNYYENQDMAKAYVPEYKLTLAVHAEYDLSSDTGGDNPPGEEEPKTDNPPGNEDAKTDNPPGEEEPKIDSPTQEEPLLPGDDSPAFDDKIPTEQEIPKKNNSLPPEDETTVSDKKINKATADIDGGDDKDNGVISKLRGVLPKTGDATNIVLWILLMIVCAAGAAAIIVVRRRNRKEEDRSA
jgi:LPXTG-motif cell wall-anchored protein